jgi:UDP-N-acetylglucosamine 2-epimerase (non-hydrolysing)
VKVLSAVGARPKFVKLTPFGAAPGATRQEHVIARTYPHHDAPMSGVERDLEQ